MQEEPRPTFQATIGPHHENRACVFALVKHPQSNRNLGAVDNGRVLCLRWLLQRLEPALTESETGFVRLSQLANGEGYGPAKKICSGNVGLLFPDQVFSG